MRDKLKIREIELYLLLKLRLQLNKSMKKKIPRKPLLLLKKLN
jgi:hypothetical protein